MGAIITTTTSRTIICPLVWQKRPHVGAIWCVPRWTTKAHKTKSLYQWLRVQMGRTIYTLHYILWKGAMKCVWDIVPVHVSLHGISDCRCCYKVSANEFCQRQLWTWWNGRRGDEKLALCALGGCCIATPASFRNPCLTCVVRVWRNPGLRSNSRDQWSAPAPLPLFNACPELESGAASQGLVSFSHRSFSLNLSRVRKSSLACGSKGSQSNSEFTCWAFHLGSQSVTALIVNVLASPNGSNGTTLRR